MFSQEQIETFRSNPAGYSDFIASKNPCLDGISAKRSFQCLELFGFQHDIVDWALRRGRAAVFADCGLGKTPIQLVWAENIVRFTNKPVLIFAPLAVNDQTVSEGQKFGVNVWPVEEQSDIQGPAIYITNYEKMHKFSHSGLGGIVLDESSILKSFDGITRTALIQFASQIEYRLCCTATPAPNDILEISNHADFLGLMTPKEVQAMFFRLDGNTTHKWRLKKHAEEPFWSWLASWSVSLRRPSDLGYSDDGFILPQLYIQELLIRSDGVESVKGVTDRIRVRRLTLESRVAECADLINSRDGLWVVWCELNQESNLLRRLIPGSVELLGSQTHQQKDSILRRFRASEIRVLITKPKLSGFGVNWQHCHQTAFVGLSDSYEAYYQTIRRFWRFGQYEEVQAYVIVSDAEKGVVDNIKRKEGDVERMMNALVARTSVYSQVFANKTTMPIESDLAAGHNWEMYLGDAYDILDAFQPNSVGLSVFSPPFPSMYVYTNSPNDVGNVKSIQQLIEQLTFPMIKVLDVTMPGRSCCIHLTQAVAFLGVDGYMGFKDFRGLTIEMMERIGWIYYGKVCIDKNPQVKAIRTHDAGLLFKTLNTDSSKMHMCLADYIIQFKKRGVNTQPIRAGIPRGEENNGSKGWITSQEWIEWAAPVWYRQTPEYPTGIKETDVLKYQGARGDQDEKHICPLQLGVIERCIKLWSNPSDLVLDPFAGIGSVGVKALEYGRRFAGIELKRDYWKVAVENLNK